MKFIRKSAHAEGRFLSRFHATRAAQYGATGVSWRSPITRQAHNLKGEGVTVAPRKRAERFEHNFLV